MQLMQYSVLYCDSFTCDNAVDLGELKLVDLGNLGTRAYSYGLCTTRLSIILRDSKGGRTLYVLVHVEHNIELYETRALSSTQNHRIQTEI